MYEKILSKRFFRENPLKEISAQKIAHFSMLDKGMGNLVAEIASEGIDPERLDEVAKEKTMILSEDNPEALVKLSRKGVDMLNSHILRDRMLEFEDDIIPDLLKRLITNFSDKFIEGSVRILKFSKKNYSKELLDSYNSIKNEYTKSLICLVLGFRGDEDIIPWMYDQYILVENKYPDENYSQGSLIALYELNARFYEK